jgi:hypothetical protein
MKRSRDMQPEALKNMIRSRLESMVGAMEKVMNGVSDGMPIEKGKGSGRKCRGRKK